MTGEDNRSFQPEAAITANTGRAWTSTRDALNRVIRIEPEVERLGVGRDELKLIHDALDARLQLMFGEG